MLTKRLITCQLPGLDVEAATCVTPLGPLAPHTLIPAVPFYPFTAHLLASGHSMSEEAWYSWREARTLRLQGRCVTCQIGSVGQGGIHLHPLGLNPLSGNRQKCSGVVHHYSVLPPRTDM
jgi:hypothetical protein